MQDRGSVLSAHGRHKYSYMECTSDMESGKAMKVAFIRWVLIFFLKVETLELLKAKVLLSRLFFYVYLLSCYLSAPAIKHQFL